MMSKRLFILLVVSVSTLSLASLALSGGTGKEIKGTVASIEGNKITILDRTGDVRTVGVRDREMLKDPKVGDRVSVKNGVLKKEGAGSTASYPILSR